MTLPVEIARLVEKFDWSRESYAQGRYSETQLRREYIDPFFKALDWDMDNTRGWAEVYKDVIHEEAIRIGSTVKAPDHRFRIAGTRKFFVEAMLQLHKSLAGAKAPTEKAVLERQIAATDGQIDAPVYELYGLTDAEIKIVEAATHTP